MVGEGLLSGECDNREAGLVCVLTWEELRVVALGKPLGAARTY